MIEEDKPFFTVIPRTEDSRLDPSYSIYRGITDNQIRELVHYAQTDEPSLAFTGDQKRFASVEDFQKWRTERDRNIYVLTNKAGKLLGITWLGEKPLPKDFVFNSQKYTHQQYTHTVATRVYDEARGRGVSSAFLEAAAVDYASRVIRNTSKPYGIWAEIDRRNVRSIAMMRAVSFEMAAPPNNRGKVLMVV